MPLIPQVKMFNNAERSKLKSALSDIKADWLLHYPDIDEEYHVFHNVYSQLCETLDVLVDLTETAPPPQNTH